MTRTTLVAACVCSLVLAGTQGAAQAEKSTSTVTADSSADVSVGPPGVFTLLGKTLCLSTAPRTADCDWRWPSTTDQTASPDGPGFSFALFGTRYCAGATPPRNPADCDVWFSSGVRDGATGPRITNPIDTKSSTASVSMEPKVIDILGMRLCFGKTPSRVNCDLSYP